MKIQCVSTIFSVLLLLPLATVGVAQDKTWTPLWPQGAPGAKGTADKDVPALMAFPAPADKATGCGVVVCPGGGYGGLAMDHEGHQIAAWFNARGIHAWILRYRLGSQGYHHPIQKGDVARAIRTVRAQAATTGTDPLRLGVMGFSAGGHLASTAATHFDDGDATASDPIDRVSSRPDFAILCYPVITMERPFTHEGSRRNLLGPDNTENDELVQLLSNHKRVTEKTPPTFLFHTLEDSAVPVENALEFYAALRRSGNKASELHVYQNGRHGVGLAQADPILKNWPDRLYDWMQVNKFTTAVTP